MEALRKCPFCGSEASLDKTGQRAYVTCSGKDCKASIGLLFPGKDWAEVLTRDWNRREAQRPATAKGEDLREAAIKARDQAAEIWGSKPPRLETEEELDHAWRDDASAAQAALIYWLLEDALATQPKAPCTTPGCVDGRITYKIQNGYTQEDCPTCHPKEKL